MKIVFLAAAAAVLLMCGAAWAVEMQVSAELDSVCIVFFIRRALRHDIPLLFLFFL